MAMLWLDEVKEWSNEFAIQRNRDQVGNAVMVFLFGFAIGYVLAWWPAITEGCK